MITSLAARLFFIPRSLQFERRAAKAPAIQKQILKKLMSRAANTVWGKEFHYSEILRSGSLYEEFAATVPVCDYKTLENYIDRVLEGEGNVLCPGKCGMFAMTSSTTSTNAKRIPVFKNNLRDTHFRGGTDSTAAYLRHNKGSSLFSGKTLILCSSSFPESDTPYAKASAISPILFKYAPKLISHFKAPTPELAMIHDFGIKLEAIAKQTSTMHITALAGQPAWLLELLKKVLTITGKDNITQVWPDLEVFFHGGMPFTSYRPLFKQIIPSPKMKYVETYNASEGFFGVQTDPDDSSMSLCIDYGIFYEFIPYREFLNGSRAAVPVWDISSDVDYVMLISTSGGLWRYIIGDVVNFTSVLPPKFRITGRTSQHIDLKGEAINVDAVTEALSSVCGETGSSIREFTVGPEIMSDGRYRHVYLIEFESHPDSLEKFAISLDSHLQKKVHDYQMTRDAKIVDLPVVIGAKNGAFLSFLASIGHLDAQYKVPRLSESMDLIKRINK